MTKVTENAPEIAQALIVNRAALLARTEELVNKATSTATVSAHRVARTEELLVGSARLLACARRRRAQLDSHNGLNGGLAKDG